MIIKIEQLKLFGFAYGAGILTMCSGLRIQAYFPESIVMMKPDPVALTIDAICIVSLTVFFFIQTNKPWQLTINLRNSSDSKFEP